MARKCSISLMVQKKQMKANETSLCSSDGKV